MEEGYTSGHYVEGIRVGVLKCVMYLYGPLLCSSFSSFRPSVSGQASPCVAVILSVTIFKGTFMYWNIERRVVAAELECVMIHQLPTVEHIVTVPGASVRVA